MESYWILFPIASYLLCSIPFGRFIGLKAASIEITERGSGNIGATNVAREIGLKWGILTLALDVLKGFIPVYLFVLLFPDHEIGISIVGLSALLGHQFSLYQRFRGGKGVATALGIYLALFPLPSLIAMLLFTLTVYLFDIVSIGSILSASIMPVLLLSFGNSGILTITSLIIAALICLKHKDNIQRLIKGEERRWRRGAVMKGGQKGDPIPHRSKNR